MLPLPKPVDGGKLEDFRKVANLREEEWPLVAGLIVGYFNPSAAQAITMITGEQGSGKTTLCKMIRELIDPNKTKVRASTSVERDIIIAANNSWLLAFDNVSNITNAQSDTYCRAATGSGFGARQLYADDKEFQAYIQNPILLNSIDHLELRSDMLSRTIRVHLPSLQSGGRKLESTIWKEFEEMKPRIFRAICNCISAGLKNLDTVPNIDWTRLADFVRFIVAAEESMGLAPGSFKNAYERMQADSDLDALEQSGIGDVLAQLMRKKKDVVYTCSQLLIELNNLKEELEIDVRRWPANARALSSQLRRIAPNLLRCGISVEFLPRSQEAREIHIKYNVENDYTLTLKARAA